MSGTNPRAVRVAGLIQRVVATALQRELRDPRLAHVTITEVRVTNDLQIARIYWTYLGSEGHELGQRKRAKQALKQSAGRLRSLVGRKTKSLKRRMRSRTFCPSLCAETRSLPSFASMHHMPGTPIPTVMTMMTRMAMPTTRPMLNMTSTPIPPTITQATASIMTMPKPKRSSTVMMTWMMTPTTWTLAQALLPDPMILRCKAEIAEQA